MQRTQQRVAPVRLALPGLFDPALDGLQVALHLGVEDLQQQRIDAGRHRLDRWLRRGFDVDKRRLGRCIDQRRRGHGRRLRRQGLVAGRDAVGGVLEQLQVGGQPTLAAQRRLQFRQGVERAVNHRDDRRTGRPRAVEHAVEHVLDLPAELAQRTRAHQPAAALEGVEHAPDRAQPLHVLGHGAPLRKQRIEVVDLLGEFLEEDLADLLVDLLAHGLEAARHRPHRQRRCRCRNGGGLRNPEGRRRRGSSGFREGRGFDRLGQVHGHVDGGFGDLPGKRRLALHHRRRGRLGWRHRLGKRPVPERLQAAARDVKDLVAVAALLAQRFQVVLQAGQRVGQRVQLAAVGHALARDQFVVRVAADGDQVVGRLRQFHHPQRAGHLVEQARHVAELLVLPAGLDEGHQRLAGLHEIGDRLAHDGVDHLSRLAGKGFACGAGRLGGAQSRHLVVQGGVDVEQRAGDIQQRVLVRGDRAIEDRLQAIALLLHHLAGRAQAEHAERVGHAAQGLGMGLQRRQVVRAGAQVQVERVLDVKQVVLHRRRHGIEQRAVAPADAALGVFELGLGRQRRLQLEHLAQFAQRGMDVVGMVGDVVEQLPRRFLRAFAAGLGIAVVVKQGATRLAFDAREYLAQRRRDRQRTIGHRARDAGGHPQHALHRHLADVAQQGFQRRGQVRKRRRRGVFLPLPDLAPQRFEQGRHVVVGGRARGHDRAGKRALQVGREQHALAEQALAARGAQLVEQRQQHDRDVAVPALQALEVVGQQHDAAQQCGAGAVAVGDGAAMQAQRDLLHLLGHHRRRVQLDHAQGALHLVQVAGAQAHAADVGRVLDVVLELGLG